MYESPTYPSVWVRPAPVNFPSHALPTTSGLSTSQTSSTIARSGASFLPHSRDHTIEGLVPSVDAIVIILFTRGGYGNRNYGKGGAGKFGGDTGGGSQPQYGKIGGNLLGYGKHETDSGVKFGGSGGGGFPLVAEMYGKTPVSYQANKKG